eukprot:gnl/Chilomastix_caulleri/8003.p1 GENE.gnl/Chilomastix_caulleri/8003~~gnl/Chilomastix_caulleri/8003.p1  ORF type:complete len:81 (+),score=6.77 gnl/Chilomastix_caulleri/8003:131-373(+)
MNDLVYEYLLFDEVERIFPKKNVYSKQLTNIGLGVKASNPIKTERWLFGGDYLLSSISHKGVMAVYAANSRRKSKVRQIS